MDTDVTYSTDDLTAGTVRAQQEMDQRYERSDHGIGKSFKTNSLNSSYWRSSRSSRKSKHSRRSIRCWGCGRFDHKIARCWWTTPNEGNFVQDFLHGEDNINSHQNLNWKLAVGRVGRAVYITIVIWLLKVCSQVNC